MEKINEIHSLELGNGETYGYRHISNPQKPSLILVHGNASSSIFFLPLFKVLGQSYNIYAPDLRGFGRSSYNTPITSLDDFADDLKHFCDKLNLKGFVLLGWSMGGGISMKFVAKNPEYVTKLILHCSMGFEGYPFFNMKPEGGFDLTSRCKNLDEIKKHPIVAMAVVRNEKKDMNAMMASLKIGVFNGVKVPESDVFEAYCNECFLQRNSADVIYAMNNNFNMGEKNNGIIDGTNEISKIKCKTLILAGKKDILVPFVITSQLKEVLGDNATLTAFDDCGHAVMEDHPEEVSNAIKEFIGV